MKAIDKELFKGIFQDRKVLITGHTGFKGSWITFWLHHLGANIIGYSLEPPTSPSLFEDLSLEQKITHVTADVADEQKLKEVFDEYQPEIVFHMAAQPLVRYSYQEPVETYRTNVMGTVNLFEAVRNTPSVKVVVNITSDKCYENKEIDYAYKEDDPMGGFDPYSSSKGCAELVTAAYRQSFFKSSKVGLASVRAGNVVGGGDWALDRIIPDCIKALNNDQMIEIRNPQAVRPWQHVLEPLSGYLWLASRMWQDSHIFDGGWNFGPNDSNNITVEKVVDLVVKFWGSGSWGSSTSDSQPHEAKLLKLDYTKAKELLGWMPVLDTQTTFKTTIEWYKAYSQKEDIELLTINDINNYVEQAKKNNLSWALTNRAGVIL